MFNSLDYKTLFEATNIGMAAVRDDSTILMANKKLLDILQVNEDDFINSLFPQWIYESDRDIIKQYHAQRIKGNDDIPRNYEVRLKKKNKFIWVFINITFLKDSGITLASVLDITQSKEIEQKLQETISAQNAILTAIPDLMFELDSDGTYLNIWAQNPQELAATEKQLLGNKVLDMLPKSAAAEVMLAIGEVFIKGASFGHQIQIETPDGELWFELSASLKNNTNMPSTVIILSRNITEGKKLEFELRHLSRHDSLTNLYNRRTLLELLGQDIHRASRYKTPFSLCMLDIDYFKHINDTYGHIVGDNVLQGLSNLLRDILRDIDYTGRYGGEEFIIALPQTTLSQASEFSERLRNKIAALKFQDDSKNVFSITISIGIAEFNERYNSVDSLVNAADSAMYHAKKSGRNCVKSI